MDECKKKLQSSLEKSSISSDMENRRKMSEEEEDMIARMHKLVGDKWELIAGRIPGRKADEIQRFWLNNKKTNTRS
ncbi:MYB-like transcription factor ETC3 [Andrographis paniculata]|uniref:MYB-like transcription factor ETC3 n=1 Tax=Andrographis paniculata TaxID=175694 RepID=UPI0021E78F33|nr:MYB-like transcription factor ETC3 [Andrographis paniculata]